MISHQDQRGTVREFTVHDSPPQNGEAERGMRTRAERARALLIASGLRRFLWEEAMKHATWLQNRTPAGALDGKTPYEAIHGKKPHLVGIQEFGAAAYVKDLKAGKLDARAQLGRFVGYDSESKGYRIYWPGKRSVSVERNVVFNESDIRTADGTVSISGGVLSEGERESEKVIQYSGNRAENLEKPQTNQNSSNLSEKEATDDDDDSETPNTIPFPTDPEPESEPQTNAGDGHQELGRGKRVAPKPQGIYKKMHGGLIAGIAYGESPNYDDPLAEIVEDAEGNNLPLNLSLLDHVA